MPSKSRVVLMLLSSLAGLGGAAGGASGSGAASATEAQANRGGAAPGWSEVRGGLRIRLELAHATMVEGGDVGSMESESPLTALVYIQNASNAVQRYHPITNPSHTLRWEITGPGGARWRPHFLPPPMPTPSSPLPAPDQTTRTIAPGEEHFYERLSGMSGYVQGDPQDVSFHELPPPGRYTIVVRGIQVGGVDGTFSSNPLMLTVLRPGEPVAGLRLALRAEPSETRMTPDGRNALPVRLHLTFTNVGRQPLRLDLHDLARRLLTLRVQGGSAVYRRLDPNLTGSPAKPPGVAADYPILAPGQSLTPPVPIAFPGPLGDKEWGVRQPGSYQLKLVYRRQATASAPAPAGECWSGEVAANLLSIRGLPSQ